jgi:DNA-binding CsgD family transcriptional regulator/tetratricopeptide (TPR) repeat protein
VRTRDADAAEEALRGGRWKEARTAYEAALAAEETPAALEGLGLALRWLEEFPRCFEVQERAYLLYRQAGDLRGAARLATRLGRDNLIVRADAAVASGWLARAERLLEDEGDCSERGWLSLRQGQIALFGFHDAAKAEEAALTARRCGAESADTDLEMAAIALAGLALVRQGRVDDGMRLLDEASAAAISGEVAWRDVAGAICCDLIYACEYVHDHGRAGQWCEATAASARRDGVGGVFGVCRAHYASVLMYRGDWAGAEGELESAADVLEQSARGMAYETVLRLAELRRRQARFEEAERLCAKVAWHARAQLCRAAIYFERGRLDDAADCLHAHLRAVQASDRLGRVPGLELAVALRLARNDREGAQAAVDELSDAAERGGSGPLLAARDLALARLDRHDGELERTRTRLEDALAGFGRAGLPFEEAETRLELAEVLAASGRARAAARERELAAAAYRELGCEERAAAVESPRANAPLTKRELEVLRLVADGLSEEAIAKRLVISPHTVHRHVANVRTKLRQPSRAAAVAHAAREGLI